jgi:hypothetical protein
LDTYIERSEIADTLFAFQGGVYTLTDKQHRQRGIIRNLEVLGRSRWGMLSWDLTNSERWGLKVPESPKYVGDSPSLGLMVAFNRFYLAPDGCLVIRPRFRKNNFKIVMHPVLHQQINWQEWWSMPAPTDVH